MAKKPTRKTNKTPSVRAEISTTATTSSRTPAFNPDYSYVTKDLRRIGLLAGTFVTILVILSFFLR
jgi:hypothetical protein